MQRSTSPAGSSKLCAVAVAVPNRSGAASTRRPAPAGAGDCGPRETQYPCRWPLTLSPSDPLPRSWPRQDRRGSSVARGNYQLSAICVEVEQSLRLPCKPTLDRVGVAGVGGRRRGLADGQDASPDDKGAAGKPREKQHPRLAVASGCPAVTREGRNRLRVPFGAC